MSDADKIVPFPVPGHSYDHSVDDERLADLFETLKPRLHAYLCHRLGSVAEAQDAQQVVFLRLWEKRTDIRADNLTALAFVTARNHATDRLRQQKRQRAIFENGDGLALEQLCDSEAPGPDRVMSARQDLILISGIVSELPEKCRRAFIRCKFEEAEYAEVAGELGITESMVRKYVLRAMAHCAHRFSELEGWQ